jgi:molybdenum cofactor biosynthesis enzyme MoaA
MFAIKLSWSYISRIISGYYLETKIMTTGNHNSVAKHRKRLKDLGLARIEVQVPSDDAELIRRTAQSLRGEMAATLRVQLQRLVGASSIGLKDILASAPLDDIDLTRDRDVGRGVEL